MFESLSEQNAAVVEALEISTYKEVLSRSARYEQYLDKLSHDNEEMAFRAWAEDILDADVNNYQHLAVTALIARTVAGFEGLSSEESEDLEMLGWVHDLAEAIHGDTTYDDVQKQGHEAHKRENLTLLDILCDGDFPISDEKAAQLVSCLNDSKLADPETKLGLMFEIVERIGYVRTALVAHKAVRASEKDRFSPEQYNRLNWLTENVFANHIERLVELSGNHASVRSFLDASAEEIDLAIFTLESDVAWMTISPYYEARGDDVAMRENKWHDSFAAWINYEMQHNNNVAEVL